ncbi:C25 family cysteine peptidase [Hymenobacter psoromatis]|uniref:putative type IX secretion system sortase PorU2 n=1 Tax=Hymenobacter psoromatis TaxID=1484116 RepID=UPI001CBDBCC9|nr:C25 family cysteine peptidase [Hymenobacter psoromatis]
MDNKYLTTWYWWSIIGKRWGSLGLLVLAGLLLSPAARAQSGPYGNEWIVPGQTYYKLKVTRDGLYRLDYAYLSRLSGSAGVAPTQLQLWRRGREVAIYQGGNAAALDNTTYLEFYGQRNDGQLDRDLYKVPSDQGNPFYSFYTDTATYFVTWSAGRPGKRMAQPAAAGGAPHAWRMQSVLTTYHDFYFDSPNTDYYNCLPWLERGEGFSTPRVIDITVTNDSLLRAIVTLPAAPLPRAEVLVIGGTIPAASPTRPVTQHLTSIGITPPGGAYRQDTILAYRSYDFVRRRIVLQRSDISSAGTVQLTGSTVRPITGPPYDFFRFGYLRVTAPQENRWFSDRASLAFQNDSLLSGPATYELDNIPATVTGYDVQDPWNVQRIAPAAAQTLGSTGRRFVFPAATSAQTRQLLLADAARPLVPPAPIAVHFRAINPAKANFLIITHPQLMKAAGAEPNAARAYANYRASGAGGGYDTLMVTAPQLYDQFHYGERSLLALRHFALWANAAAPTQTKYLLLLGKGLSPNSYYRAPPNSVYTYPFVENGLPFTATTRALGELGMDLVPTSSRAPSDNLLTSDWQHDNYAAKLPTGRVPATTPADVLAYLNKLKEHEALGPESWRKSVLHLVGGHSTDDYREFAGYLDKYKRIIERPLFGGQVKTYAKSGDGLPTSINIAPELNSGLSLISYFGHGSTTVADLDIGDINDPVNNYHNAGRYPVMMYDGCDFGACFVSAPVFSTNWLLAPNKGAIGVFSQSDFSYAYLLDPVETQLHTLLFNNPAWFGRPVAEVYNEVVRRLQNTAPFVNNPSGAIDLLATVWQGDPALRLYAPARPDFVANGVSLTPANPVATASSLQLTISVSNPARITFDSVEVRLTRSYSPQNGAAARKPEVFLRTFRQAWQTDTTYTITIPNTGNVFGTNKFVVELDYRNKVAELSETNNTAELSYTFFQGGVMPLTPTEFAIVPGPTPRLVAQSNDLTGPVRGYDFQVDSVASFDSKALQTRNNLQAAAVASWTPAALLPAAGRDSVVWYWRVRFTIPTAQEDPAWKVSSFRILPKNLTGGWSQSHNGQFNRDQLLGVTVSTPGNRWAFAGQQQGLQLRTVGGGAPGATPTFSPSSGYGIFSSTTSPPALNDCGINAPNLLVVAFDEHTLQRLTITQGGPYLLCGQGDQFFYHFAGQGDTLDNLNNSAARQAQLQAFLSNVPDGAYVALISVNRLRYASLLPALGSSFSTALGSRLITQLKNGSPWALVAQKRASGGHLIQEVGPDQGLSQAAFSQAVSLNTALTAPGQAGSVTSTLIGPARQWQTLYNTIRRETPSSSYTLTLSGVDATGKATVLNGNVGSQPVDLSAYSTATYPYMQLQLALRDSVSRTPPQLKQWLITYKGLPEGVVRRDLVAAAVYDTTRLKNQALNTGIISFPVKFDNVSQEAFASRLQVQVQLISVATGLPIASTTKLLPAPRDLGANDSVLTVNVSLNVKGIFGRVIPRVFVNPQLQPELYYFNNELDLQPFTIPNTSVPPTLDVAVDGRHILDGELVSPTPVISIQLKDGDKLRHITKASNFTVFLQKGNDPAQAIDVNGPLVVFSVDSTAGSVARLEFSPGKNGLLADGIYTLRVQGRNGANASASTQDFQVKFEVVQRSTITNVYPYPNPVTSKARFVFTVTGQELPRNMKIQIMTITGRVVREIFMSELGPLHIGNNITDYAWDGTDQYGDRLANGTYLYRVSLDQSGGTFERRATAGDQAFKNDWGKLVLLR